MKHRPEVGVPYKIYIFQAEKRKMATLFLFYKDEHQLTLNKLMDEFCTKVKKLGVDLKAGDFKDV
jgi:hypothetical protein